MRSPRGSLRAPRAGSGSTWGGAIALTLLMLPLGSAAAPAGRSGVAAHATSRSLVGRVPDAAIARAAPQLGGTNTVVATLAIGDAPLPATYDPANGLVYVPANGNELVVVRGGASPAIVATIPFLPSDAAVETPVYVPSTGALYVPIQAGGSRDELAIVNGTTNTVTGAVPTGNGSAPTTPLYDPADDDLFVPDEGTDAISVIDVATDALVATIPVGQEPTTPALDAADGYLYVPDFASNDLSVIAPGRDAVVATVTGLAAPLTPTYDPANQELFVPESNDSNVSIVAATGVVATVDVGDSPGTPYVDPVTGDVYVPNTEDSNLSVIAAEDNAVTAIGTGVGPTTPILDPANGQLYEANAIDGSISDVDPAAAVAVATVGVGDSPDPPTFDDATDQLFVPNYGDTNLSIVAAGAPNRSNAPGTYSLSFDAAGLPSGARWSVTLGGSNVNSTNASIVFYDLSDGSFPYAVQPPAGYGLLAPTPSGTLVIAGADQAVPVSLEPLTAGGGGSNGSSSSGLFDLPPLVGYAIAGGGIILAAVLLTVVLTPKRDPRPAAEDEEEGPEGATPPLAPTVPAPRAPGRPPG